MMVRLIKGIHYSNSEWESQSDEPFGWKHFLLSTSTPRSKKSEEADFGHNQGPLQSISVWVLQIAILANQQNGKDTHIRGCLVWGPKRGKGGGGEEEVAVAAAGEEGTSEAAATIKKEEDDLSEDSWEDLGRASSSNNQADAALWRSLR